MTHIKDAYISNSVKIIFYSWRASGSICRRGSKLTINAPENNFSRYVWCTFPRNDTCLKKPYKLHYKFHSVYGTHFLEIMLVMGIPSLASASFEAAVRCPEEAEACAGRKGSS